MTSSSNSHLIFAMSKNRYFQAGGSPEQVIELLSTNYNAFAQMANLMAEWIISAGRTRFCDAMQYTIRLLDYFFTL